MLKTGSQIKHALGDKLLNFLNRMDPSELNRKTTGSMKQKEFANIVNCQCCQRTKDEKHIKELQLAHITPVMIGGVTKKTNLLLLCTSPKTKKPSVDNWGCHQLFDGECSMPVHESFKSYSKILSKKQILERNPHVFITDHRQAPSLPRASPTLLCFASPKTQKN